jgi:hypothetical protein
MKMLLRVIKFFCGRKNAMGMSDKLTLFFFLRAVKSPTGETIFKMVTSEKGCQRTVQYRRRRKLRNWQRIDAVK